MANLRTDYRDDVLDTSVNTKRKFNMITNLDGTVSFEDVTKYAQVGDSYGSTDINETNGAVNELLQVRLSGLSFVKLTQSQYDALATKDPNTIYFTA